VSVPTATGETPTGASGHDAVSDPPSLRRRAPARLDIWLNSGQFVTMTRRKFHLLSGQSFVVQVVPQSPTTKVEIAAEPPLHTIVPASRVEGGSTPTYHAEFCGRLLLRFPLPTTGRLHVRIIDGLLAPCRITIPVTVWPAYSTLILWWLLAFLGIVGLRWQKIAADRNSYEDIFEALWRDLPFSLGLLALGFLIVIPLRIVGWVVSLAEPGQDRD
jgi:hypothetical protein